MSCYTAAWRGSAKINDLGDEETFQHNTHIAFAYNARGMLLKKLAWLADTAYVASWMQCAGQVAELVGAVVPQMKLWHDGNLLCWQDLQAETEINTLDRDRANNMADAAHVVPTQSPESDGDEPGDHQTERRVRQAEEQLQQGAR